MIKKGVILFFLGLFVILSISPIKAETPVVIHYFYSSSCTVCKQATDFLDSYLPTEENVTLIKYNILEGGDNEAWFIAASDVFHRESLRYPYIIVGGKDLQGLYEITEYLPSLIDFYQADPYSVDIIEKIKTDALILPSDFLTEPFLEETSMSLPLIGEINLETFSLLLGAVLIGLIDGFNPCAMWILIFLISMLINLKDRKKMWLLGMTFILTSGIVYYVIMMSWLQLVIQVAMIQSFQIGIGVLAIVFSFFNLKHFIKQLKNDTGCEVTTIDSKRKLMKRIKAILQKEQIPLAMLGIVGVALTVNLIELACSAGLPVIYTTMLAYHDLPPLTQALYILVYVLFFMADDLLIFTLAAVTFKVTGISTKYAKYSNLFGGIIMLALGILLIFFPSILI